MRRQRDFLLFIALAAAIATPALAQTVASGRAGQRRNERRRIDPAVYRRLDAPGLSLV